MASFVKRFGVLLGASLVLLSAGSASALECPVKHMSATDRVLKETPDMIASTAGVLAQGGAKAAPEVIANLRSRHPKASNGMIMNYLITAYCPAIKNRPDLSEAQKRGNVRDFSRATENLLYK
jgi:hypothetical protein